MGVPQPDYGPRHVAALVLMVEPGRWPRIDPGLVATALGLTRAESQVAVWLAEGKRVRDMATATGLTEGAIYWHLKQIYRKLPISRLAEDTVGSPKTGARTGAPADEPQSHDGRGAAPVGAMDYHEADAG